MLPGTRFHIAAVPTDKVGNPKIKEVEDITKKYKLQARKEYIKSKKAIGEKVSTKAENLLPGSSNEHVKKDYENYLRWIARALDAPTLKDRAKEEGATDVDIKNYVLSKDVSEFVTTAQEEMQIELKALNIHSNPFVMFDIGFDREGALSEGFEDIMEEAFKKYPYADNIFKDADPYESDYISGVADADSANPLAWVLGDNHRKMTVMIPLETLASIESKKGATTEQVQKLTGIEHETFKKINEESVFSTQSIPNILALFAN